MAWASLTRGTFHSILLSETKSFGSSSGRSKCQPFPRPLPSLLTPLPCPSGVLASTSAPVRGRECLHVPGWVSGVSSLAWRSSGTQPGRETAVPARQPPEDQGRSRAGQAKVGSDVFCYLKPCQFQGCDLAAQPALGHTLATAMDI